MDAALPAVVPDAALWTLLSAVVLPAWLAAGLVDYAIHARQRIEHSAGAHESLLHLLQAVEVGLPLLVVLFLEITASTWLALLAAVLLHAWTSWRDARYATSVRLVGPAEQEAHAVLDMLPWFALALIMLLHREALAGLFGAGPADWSLRPRDRAFDPGVVIAVLVASLLCGLAPALLELRRARREGPPTPRH